MKNYNKQAVVPVKVSGNSMYPTYKDGDVVFIKSASFYNINDVVVIKCKDCSIIHRIIKVMNTADNVLYLTKGDNNPFIDRWYSSQNIIGKVITRKDER